MINTLPKPSADGLAKILLVQNLVSQLPDEKTIFEFVCRGMKDMPGVETVHCALHGNRGTDMPQGRLPDSHRSEFLLNVQGKPLATLIFELSDPSQFLPYEPFLHNLCFTLSVIFEERRLRQALLEHQAELERRVKERTRALTHEVMERKKAQEKLKILVDELQRSNRDLEQFAFVASHDLQEPLRMVNSYVQLLARRYKGRLDDDADEFIHFAIDGSNRMQKLINALLDYSRVGGKNRVIGPVNMDQVLDKTLAVMKPSLDENGAQIERQPLPTIMAEPALLGQLFQNLISNAVKFRGEDPLAIKISAVPEGENFWRITVKDNGLGIEPEFREKVFNIFRRLHGPEVPGTGIGLAICKKIVEFLGGRIWVDSDPGGGATFHFTLKATSRND